MLSAAIMVEGMVVVSCGVGMYGAVMMFEGEVLGWRFKIVVDGIADCMMLRDGFGILG